MSVIKLPEESFAIKCHLCKKLIGYEHEDEKTKALTYFNDWGIEMAQGLNFCESGFEYFFYDFADGCICGECIAKFEPMGYARVGENYDETTMFFTKKLIKVITPSKAAGTEDHVDMLIDILDKGMYDTVKKGWVADNDKSKADWEAAFGYYNSLGVPFAFIAYRTKVGTIFGNIRVSEDAIDAFGQAIYI